MFETFLKSFTNIFKPASRLISFAVIGCMFWIFFGDLAFALILVYIVSLINCFLDLINAVLLEAALKEEFQNGKV